MRAKVKVFDHAEDEVGKYSNGSMTRIRIKPRLANLMTYCRDGTE